MSSHDRETPFPGLLSEARELRKEIDHVEGAIKLLQGDIAQRDAELTRTHAELAAARNTLSEWYAEAAARRAVRGDVISKRDSLARSIASSGAGFDEKAFMQQQLAHLWTLADRAIGVTP